jgi:hypothetical protein
MTHGQAVSTHATERYLLDEMSEIERHQFEEHFFDCPECADDVKDAVRMRSGVKAGLAGAAERASPAIPSRKAQVVPLVARRSWTPSIVMPWAAAAMLALAASYQTLVVVPALRTQAGAPQVVEPVTLRSASRGAEPSLRLPSAGPIAFALDLTGITAGQPLTYDLRTDAGQVVASGTATAPTPGTPLLLLVPGSAFAGPGQYALSMRAASSNEPAIDYRFSIIGQ